jgi:hypothetical protein
MDEMSNDILDGSCRCYDEYRYATGLIHGMARAERELLDLDEELIQN